MTSNKKETIDMSKINVPKSEVDHLMRSSYNSLINNKRRTIIEFIVYTEGDKQVEIPAGTGQRIKFINKLINYFEVLEEYEKCQELIELKGLVLRAENEK